MQRAWRSRILGGSLVRGRGNYLGYHIGATSPALGQEAGDRGVNFPYGAGGSDGCDGGAEWGPGNTQEGWDARYIQETRCSNYKEHWERLKTQM